ncbi:uncharacterized protein KY384_008578 [Bacidia gigantensis]|uniref:uncharacterized protein n=1 Tax=Bacidia gigantensis TaxID=2732470 RepID=UPI001D0529F2|nr:uncharacterized protein KY384_008578 [Bacidia gigantensis]KAG8527148.1 hypothetical protein KY384_008578 [Bacidia gigantensis]
MKYATSLLLAALVAQSRSLPVDDAAISVRADTCTGGSSTPYDATCFGTLALGEWVQNWFTKTPKCTGQTINNLFTNWFLATKFAASDATSIIPSMIALLDPEEKASTSIANILLGLTTGLAFLAFPEAGPEIPAAVATIGGIVTTALQQAPSVVSALLPTGDAASQTVQIADIQSHLSDLNTQISSMLDSALHEIMTNVTAFAAFASSGAFSSPSNMSLPSETKELGNAFKTFAVTAAMAGNGWRVFQGPAYDDATAFNSSLVSQRVNFGCNIKPNGVCDTIDSHGPFPTPGQPEDWSEYTSKVTKRSYYATHDASHPTSAETTNAIVDNGWSSLEAVFDGAYDCGQQGGDGGPVVKVGPDGKLDFSCLSQLTVKDGCRHDGPDWHYCCGDFFESHPQMLFNVDRCKSGGPMGSLGLLGQ